MVFGAGLSRACSAQIGDAIHRDSLQHDRPTSRRWALPFEALYRDALRALTSGTAGLTGAIVQLGPLGGSQPPARC